MTENPGAVTAVDDLDLPEFDVRGPEFTADPLGVLGRARAVGPLGRSHRGIEVLTYDLISRLLTDDRFDTAGVEHYRRLGAPDAVLRFVDDGLLSTMERDRHDRVRRVLARAFSIRRIDEQRSLMREVGGRLLDGFAGRGHCDLVGEFSDIYPMQVLCRLIGIPPDDIETFSGDAHALHLLAAVPMGPGFPTLEEAYQSLERYVIGLLDERRRRPQADFISALIEAQETEGRLTESELVGNIVNLIFAGAGTTRMQLASAVRVFVDQDLWDRLAGEPELLPAALEEALRYYPVTQFVVRIPLEDAVVDNVLFPKGTRVLVNLLAGSRDPVEFPDPDRFDLARGERRSRLPFGWGVHHCLGHALARTQMTVALELLLSQLRDVRVTSTVVKVLPSAMLGGPDRLDLTFARRSLAGGGGGPS
jgi:cytochrome P450